MAWYFYRPLLADGSAAPIPWQILVLRSLMISWPLEDGCPRWFRRFVRGVLVFLILMYTYIHYGNWYLMYKHYADVRKLSKCLCTYIVLCELQSRSFYTAYHKEEFRQFLHKFYGQFYVEESKHPRHFRHIQLRSLPATWYSMAYIVTLLLYITVFLYDWLWLDYRHTIFQQEWPYDITPLPLHLFHLAINLIVGYSAISQMYGETNLMAICVLHLVERYKMLEEDILGYADKVLELETHGVNKARIYRLGLVRFIKKHAQLHEMVGQMIATFSYSLFVLFAMATVSVCTIMFNLTSDKFSLDNSQFLTWIVAKICELFVLSELGAQLTFATNRVSSIYYQANWERILERSSNVPENVRVLKLILNAMQVNAQPAHLNGLGFFRVAHGTVMKILQGAFSYYTFLDKVD